MNLIKNNHLENIKVWYNTLLKIGKKADAKLHSRHKIGWFVDDDSTETGLNINIQYRINTTKWPGDEGYEEERERVKKAYSIIEELLSKEPIALKLQLKYLCDDIKSDPYDRVTHFCYSIPFKDLPSELQNERNCLLLRRSRIEQMGNEIKKCKDYVHNFERKYIEYLHYYQGGGVPHDVLDNLEDKVVIEFEQQITEAVKSIRSVASETKARSYEDDLKRYKKNVLNYLPQLFDKEKLKIEGGFNDSNLRPSVYFNLL